MVMVVARGSMGGKEKIEKEEEGEEERKATAKESPVKFSKRGERSVCGG
jgi:hypothetical protein